MINRSARGRTPCSRRSAERALHHGRSRNSPAATLRLDVRITAGERGSRRVTTGSPTATPTRLQLSMIAPGPVYSDW